MLHQVFLELVNNYTADTPLADKLWNEIETNYSQKGRYYHTLDHLENIYNLLKEVDYLLDNRNTILFSLFYHDVIYSPVKKSNEEKSAEMAEKRMKSILVPEEMIIKCKLQIFATKQHLPTTDNDTNYFIDADLSILGQPWNVYSEYAKNVRKEYSIYPDIIYNPGRKKVLQHFIQMERIFKTSHFFEKYELQAKDNLKKELELY